MGTFHIPAGDAPCPSVLMRCCSFFLSYRRLPTSRLKQDQELRSSRLLPSHARSGRQTRSNAVFAARGGLPSHAQREAVHAASTCPVPRTGNASPSTLETTGKGCQQQPSPGGTRSYTSQQPDRARARAWGLLPGPLPSSQHFSPCPSLPSSPRSFCWEHRPQQATQEAPAEGTICLICLEPVGDSLSYHTMVCPACKHVWFHRGCIQVGAHPAPCRHARCSAAPGTAHAHPACASPAATGLECWHCVL
eukprot:XP_015148288.1 uncharacterized protein LOC101752068 [Gallus gallus]